MGGKNPAGLIWSNIMTQIHSNLPSAKFKVPNSVIVQSICSDSGQVAGNSCKNTYTEYFLKGTSPDNCAIH